MRGNGERRNSIDRFVLCECFMSERRDLIQFDLYVYA
jgi:hypothetical protein